MGNLMIGWYYPPKIAIGTFDVSKVMCGNEQIGPQNNGIEIQYERYGPGREGECFYITIPKEGFPESIDNVCYFEEDWKGNIYMYLVDPFKTANAGEATEVAIDADNWPWEGNMNDYAVVFYLDRDILNQAEYTRQRISVEFKNEIRNIDIYASIESPEYGDGTNMDVAPNVTMKPYDGIYNTFGVRGLGELGHVKISNTYSSRYNLQEIYVYGMATDEYISHRDEEYVEILPIAFQRPHNNGISIIGVYAQDPTLYVNFTETYRREGYDDYTDTYHGHVRIDDTGTSACGFDKTPPAGEYYTTSDANYIYLHVPIDPSGKYGYFIENFYNTSHEFNIGCTERTIRIPRSYLVPSPSSDDQINIGGTLTRRTV